MYLLNTATLKLHRFDKESEVPPYAILSHVWGDNEQTFQDTQLANNSRGGRRVFGRVTDSVPFRRPSRKIKGACAKALLDGFKWLWADTNCIDASNSAELSEAINSMFKWYSDAAMCYAYLEDVAPREDPYLPTSSFRKSKWFRRVWTLQELIAPHSVVFLSSDWRPIGAKRKLADLIESITGIDRLVLTHKRPLVDVSIACRMSWAARRDARREEDRAYSLMGIFGVCMPTIYGERGRSAFLRLQEEIVKRSPDQSIFAWGKVLHDYSCGTLVATAKDHDYETQGDTETLFASSPCDFLDCADISPIPLPEFAVRIGLRRESVPAYTPTSAGVRTTLPVVPIGQKSDNPDASELLGLLACIDGNGRLVALILRAHSYMASKLLVGGYVSQGGRRNAYHRTTRLSVNEEHLIMSARLQEVIIHSSRPPSTRERSPSLSQAPSQHSLVFFHPPCTITISASSQKELARLGYISPVIPDRGFRLTAPGETRSISFIGYQSFTVHFGVCAVEDSAGRQAQGSQLWATVTFDPGSDVDSLMVSNAIIGDNSSSGEVRPMAVYPDESSLVQHWKDHRCSFGSPSREVRLTFSYPCVTSSALAERGLAEVYELEIRFRGYFNRREEHRRYKNSVGSFTIGSVGGRAQSH
ncbi:HET-domain-containing protein [Trametes cingulata]|nr:HET-domain-containing protein [Trametes cingulata]